MTYSPLPVYSPLPGQSPHPMHSPLPTHGAHSPLPGSNSPLLGHSPHPSAHTPLPPYPTQPPIRSPPPPLQSTTTAALNMHLGALAPSPGGFSRRKKNRRGGSVSGSEVESEYESWQSQSQSHSRVGTDSQLTSVGDFEGDVNGGWAARAGPRRMKSADELRRMGMGMGMGVENIPPPPPEPEPELESVEPSQVKRYVSLGARAARPAPAPGQRNSAAPAPGQRLSRASTAGAAAQRTSTAGGATRISTAGQRASAAIGGPDDEEPSPDVSFEEPSSTNPVSPEERRKNRWGFFKKVSMGRLRSHSNADRLGHRTPAAQLGNMPDMPSVGESMRQVSPPQPIMAPSPAPAPPRVDVTSAGSPASSVLTARVLQSKAGQEPNGGGGLHPTPMRAKRRSFLPFDAPPTLNIPIPSAEPFMSSVIALGEDEAERERRADEEAARSQVALRGVMNYLRDMADLGAAGAGAVSPGGVNGGSGPARSGSGRRPQLSTLHPRHSQLNLEGYLLLPIQRIPRYKMLLDNLVTCTPPRPEATDDPLERALEEIAVLASSMNEGKRESESRSKLVQWQSRIRGKFISPLVQPHRRLIMDGRLHLVRLVKKVNNKADVSNPDGTVGQIEVPCLTSDASPKQLVAILCNDLLVLCKEPPNADQNGQVELWAVLRMQTMAQPASIVSGNGLRIVDNKAILYFNTQSTSEALTWQRAINLHIPHSQ
ncbi:hypothetical protein FRC07_005252 [Ceratobasidium sp. 392]|nr:hypothetical protein FRC07_005252 [Ceratobasidium sp. 392]